MVIEQFDELMVVCIHSTRRTRRQCPGSRETPCAGCRATILVNPLTDVFAAGGRVLHLLCPGCSIVASPAEAFVDGLVPGTVESYAEHYGISIEDAERAIATYREMPIRELAARALRNTVGGQG